MTVTGATVASFNDLTAKWIAAFAAAAQVPASYVTIDSVNAATSARRLQAATDAVTVKTLIASETPASTVQLVQCAITDGTLATALTPLGLTINGNSATVTTVRPPS